MTERLFDPMKRMTKTERFVIERMKEGGWIPFCASDKVNPDEWRPTHLMHPNKEGVVAVHGLVADFEEFSNTHEANP